MLAFPITFDQFFMLNLTLIIVAMYIQAGEEKFSELHGTPDLFPTRPHVYAQVLSEMAGFFLFIQLCIMGYYAGVGFILRVLARVR